MCRLENQGVDQQAGCGNVAQGSGCNVEASKQTPKAGGHGWQSRVPGTAEVGWMAHFWLKMVWDQNSKEHVCGELRKKRTLLWVRTCGQAGGPWWRPRLTPRGEWSPNFRWGWTCGLGGAGSLREEPREGEKLGH